MGKYFAYARVSTPRQGEKGVSLPEQKAAIERYAHLHGLEITRWFEEQQSASHTGRPAFVQMLKLLRKGAAQGIIIHKIDRSARNLEDWADVGRLVDSGVEVHFANESIDLKTVAGRLSADIQAVVAAHYSRNLREEVKKGLYGRMKQGFYPFRAPLGYLDNGSAAVKTPDPVRSPLVRSAFELYETGKYALPSLTKELYARGLRNRNGGRVSICGVERMLKNPFYFGLIELQSTGDTYRGSHEPLVSADTFEKVQAVLAGKRVDRVANHVFTYSRLVRCGTCGYSLIGERQKGFVYYRCHDRTFKTPCPPTSIREEALDKAILDCLSCVALTENEVRYANEQIEELKRDAEKNKAATLTAIRLKLQQTDTTLGRLTDLLIEGVIDKAAFEEKRRQLLIEQTKLREKSAEIEQNRFGSIQRLSETVERAKSPLLLYERASTEEKRGLLKTLLSNCLVTGKKIDISLSVPFALIADCSVYHECGPCRGTCRTWVGELIKKLINHFEGIGVAVN